MVAPFSKNKNSHIPNPNNLGQALIGFGVTVIATSLVVTAAIVALRQQGALESYELEAYDSLVRANSQDQPDQRLTVVEITQDDIRKQNQFPIWDNTLARLLKTLEEYKPRGIGIDIGRDVPIGEGRAELEKVLKENDNIIAACVLSSPYEPGTAAAPGVPPERIGFADLPQDIDAKIRRIALVGTPAKSNVPIVKPHLCNYVSEENQILSFSFRLALLYLQGEGIEGEQTEEGYIQLGPTVLQRLDNDAGGYANAGADNYQIMIRYRSGSKAVELVTLSDVLEKKVDPALLKDRVILVGYTASTVNDDFPTPYSAGKQARVEMPGVIIHAQIVSEILSAVWNNQPLIWYWPLWGEILWIFGWSVVGGTIAWKIRNPWIFIPVGGVAIAILYGSSYVLFTKAGWIPFVPPTLALVTTAASVVLIDRYSKTVTQAVKKLFRIEIQIDEAEKKRQVEQITESEGFQELIGRADKLRDRRNRGNRDDDATLGDKGLDETPNIDTGEAQEREKIQNDQDNSLEGTPDSQDTNTQSDSTDDYLQKLQRRGRRMRSKDD